ncbi:RNA-binding domain-containing protein [Neoconidiobolus thromboides FSU 785]|nr:RNA-binding domain-containing protein [Neoconidiobolus thromboides FSU 785]
MTSQLDLSLDDVIKSSKTFNGGARRKNGNDRRGRAPQNKELNDLKDVHKILISNLHYNVTVEDIKELFGQIGRIRSANINFDSNGKSQGTGEVIFVRSIDAVTAVKKYHGVTLDGRSMKLALPYTPSDAKAPISSRVGPTREFNDKRGNGNRRGGNQRRTKGRRNNESRPKKTKEELDQELDSFFTKPSTETKEN